MVPGLTPPGSPSGTLFHDAFGKAAKKPGRSVWSKTYQGMNDSRIRLLHSPATKLRRILWPMVLLGVLLILALSAVPHQPIPAGHSAPAGLNFDHIVIIAMENQNYGGVLGGGTSSTCPTSTAPFLCSMLPFSSTIPNYHSYGENINNCSAACYTAFMAGYCCPADGYGTINVPNLVGDRFPAAGLTWQAYCENGCPRGNDHFPFTAFQDVQNSPNIFTGSGVSTSQFIATANAANPPNLLWYTPTDNNNMHDNSIQTGDAYLKSFLVGSGQMGSPAAGSLLASSLFASSQRTFLYIWWDEYDPSPNIEYGSGVRTNFASSAGPDEYNSLAAIESNWGLSCIANECSHTGLDIFGSSGGPPPLTASITVSPSSPVAPATITLTASVSGGTAPYGYSWAVGSSTATGNPATVANLASGSFTATLTVTDAQAHTATASKLFSVSSPGGGGGGGGGLAQVLFGWGGIRLDEAAVGAGGINPNTSTQASCCFSGETVTNMELALIRMKALNYNTIRVDFDPSCSDNTDQNYMSAYSAANLQRAITIAQSYGFWIIVDYHGFIDFQTTNTGLIVAGFPTLRTCWLSFWTDVVNQFKNSYSQIIWEPLNEPCYGTLTLGGGGANCIAGTDMATLNAAYQAWITQDRAAGDNHWIVVQNLCSNNCGFTDYSMGYPTVTDPAKQIYISLHAYMGFPYVTPWTLAEADAYAYQFDQWMRAGQAKTGWQSVNTEIGTDPLCAITACPTAGWGQCGTPLTTCSGSAGFTAVTFEFVKYLTNLLNTNQPKPIGWIGWTAGSWTNTPGLPQNGGLDTANWGTTLGPIPASAYSGGGPGGSFISLILNNPLVIIGSASVIAFGVGLATVMGRRRRAAPVMR
jgi:Cellulase (glycosyl hydrolase family 5)/Phosphoesterase family